MLSVHRPVASSSPVAIATWRVEIQVTRAPAFGFSLLAVPVTGLGSYVASEDGMVRDTATAMR